MKNSTILLAAGMLLAGCSTVPKLGIDTRTSGLMLNKTLARTSHPTPLFTTLTPGSAAFGVLGAMATSPRGNQIISDYQVADPAESIGRELATLMEGTHGVKLVAAPLEVASSDPAAISAAAQGQADYVLDVETRIWSLMYFPTDWTHYKVSYYANARLIDTRSATVVASGTCQRVPDTNAGAPTWDELLANSAAVLKDELAVAAGACVAALTADMLKL
jgi:hypothetical protein